MVVQTLALRLQQELRLYLNDGASSEHVNIERIRENVGQLVAEALSDGDSRLSEELQSFDAWFEAHSHDSECQIGRSRLEFLLSPQPRTTNRLLRQWWRLQVLVRVAAESPSRRAIAGALGVSEIDLENALDTMQRPKRARRPIDPPVAPVNEPTAARRRRPVSKTRAPAEKSTQASEKENPIIRPAIELFSARERLQFLLDACDLLSGPAQMAEPRLEGNRLVVAGKSVRVSRLERKLLEVLLRQSGKLVPLQELKAAGVASPKDTIFRLRQKLRVQDLDLPLETSGSRYRYMPDVG